MATYEFEEGVMWEDNPWTIETDHKCSSFGGKPCKHCSPPRNKIHQRAGSGTYSETVWTCPRVVIALNEGGFNSTGVCLDCILEAAEHVNKDGGK